MKSVYSRVPSDHLGRKVHMWRFGDRGTPVLVFPSAAGMAHEWQHSGAVDALADRIEAGHIQLVCPESNVSEAWTGGGHPKWRLARHQAYERFITDELMPTLPGRVVTAGCSFGGFYAATFALKNPEKVRWGLGFSGRYRTDAFLDGYLDESVYFADPLRFVPNLSGAALKRTRQTKLTLVVGTGAFEGRCIQETHDLAWVLGERGIPHRADVWGRDVSHHWDWWRRQIRHHLARI